MMNMLEMNRSTKGVFRTETHVITNGGCALNSSPIVSGEPSACMISTAISNADVSARKLNLKK